MHRRNIFLFTLMVTMLLTAYFSNSATAGEVTRINRHKGQVFINEGKPAGFVKGAKVCFFSSSGEQLLCGEVMRSHENYAVVKVNNRETNKVNIGTEAKLAAEKDENM